MRRLPTKNARGRAGGTAQPPRLARGLLALPLVIAAASLPAACDESSVATSSPAIADAGADSASAEEASAQPGDAAPGLEGGSCELGGSFGSKICDRCMAEKCCSAAAACHADSECKLLKDCLYACLDSPDAGGCYAACMALHPDGAEKWTTVEACQFGSSADQCYEDCT